MYTHTYEKKEKNKSCKLTTKKTQHISWQSSKQRPSSLQSEGVKAHPNTVADLTIPSGCSERSNVVVAAKPVTFSIIYRIYLSDSSICTSILINDDTLRSICRRRWTGCRFTKIWTCYRFTENQR